MIKPKLQVFKIRDLGTISGISVTYVQTGNDTAESFVNLTGNKGSIKRVRWDTYKKFLDIEVNTASVAKLKRCYLEEIEKWEEFEKENKEELDLYERLKRKFGNK